MRHKKIRGLEDLRAEIKQKKAEVRQTEHSLEANFQQIAEDYHPSRLLHTIVRNVFEGQVKDPKPWAATLGYAFQWIIEYLLSGQAEKQALRKNMGTTIRSFLGQFFFHQSEKSPKSQS